MEWIDITSAATVIFGAVAAILSLDKLNDVIRKRHTEPMLSAIDFRSETEERLNQGEERMKRQDEAISLLLHGQLQVMNHIAYGDHTDELKAAIEACQVFLIKEREQ